VDCLSPRGFSAEKRIHHLPPKMRYSSEYLIFLYNGFERGVHTISPATNKKDCSKQSFIILEFAVAGCSGIGDNVADVFNAC